MITIKSTREIWGEDFPIGGEPRAVTGAMGCRHHYSPYAQGESRALDIAARG